MSGAPFFSIGFGFGMGSTVDFGLVTDRKVAWMLCANSPLCLWLVGMWTLKVIVGSLLVSRVTLSLAFGLVLDRVGYGSLWVLHELILRCLTVACAGCCEALV